MSFADRSAVFLAGAIATPLVLIVAAVLAANGGLPSHVTIALACAFIPYLCLTQGTPRGWQAAVATALVPGLAMVFASSLLSDDLYRYLWDARVTRAIADPYMFAPSSASLEGLRDALHARINNPNIPTIYPPAAQLLFLLADLVAHAPWSMKLLMLLGHLVVIPLVQRAGGERAAWLFALNPLALSESALGGHVDIFVGLAVVAFALWAKRHPLRAGLALAFATGVKLVGLLLLPLLRTPRAIALALVLCVLFVLPITSAGRGDATISGVDEYARRWEGNAGAFVVARVAFQSVLIRCCARDEFSSAERPGDIMVKVAPFAPVLRSVRGTSLDPRRASASETTRDPIDEFPASMLAGLLARALVLLFIASLTLLLAKRTRDGAFSIAHGASLLLMSALLVSPQIHPWYLLWFLPLAIANRQRSAIAWSCLVLVAYAPLDGWLAQNVWEESKALVAAEHVVVWAVAAWELLRTQGSNPELVRT